MSRLVVGLGNPGPDYAGTRHNVGYEVLDRLALHEGLLFQSPRHLEGYHGSREFQWARLFDPDAFLCKPETFMNLSGKVVAPLARFLGRGEPAPERVLVVYDDLDLPVGKLRLRPFGGAGGQKGMLSIIDSLGTDRFPRLRVGIGRPRTDAARHVLEPFSPKEREEIDISLAEAGEAILDWLREGDIEACMTRFHSRWSADPKLHSEGPQSGE